MPMQVNATFLGPAATSKTCHGEPIVADAVLSQRAGPTMPEVGVLALVQHRWSNLWQPCNHVLTRLARYFQVVWMDPGHQWSDVLFHREILHVPSHSSRPGFVVYKPEFWLPDVNRVRSLGDWSFRQRLSHARRILVRAGCRKIILYVWRPQFGAALADVPHDLSCYHIDDEYSFSPVDIPIPEEELRLLSTVDHVFIHSPALLEKKGKINPHTSFAPNGVDYDAHAQPAPEPPDLADIPHPRIGYCGHLKRQMDWPLLLDLTEHHPEWFFVFVGASNAHPEITAYVEQLSRHPNVRFLGAKTVDELAKYPQHFDVCIMPYRIDDYTHYIYPLKLHEYLASGRPVVGTPIRSLQLFADVVRLAQNPEQWSSAIAEALSPAETSPQRCSARQAVAKQHDWESLVYQIAQTMAQRLGPEYSRCIARREELGDRTFAEAYVR
jgi:glycosyltransferase involved in cell wall biosynthesis